MGTAPARIDPSASEPRVSIVIVTWRRPEHVRGSLDHLARLTPPPHQVLVVDASSDRATADVVIDYPWATRVHFPGGAGHMTRARNEGLLHVTGDIIAFLDDDAYVRPDWLAHLTLTFADPTVGALAGRTCNGEPDEATTGLDRIGRVLPDGRLTGNFAADPGEIVDVEHGIGANMSFRRAALAELGGFRDDFPGTALREDSDVFFRLRALRHRAVFNPAVAVDHVGAPHIKGRRFDWRYMFWSRHNHALLLARNAGMTSRVFWRWVWSELRSSAFAGSGSVVRRGVRRAMAVIAVACGLANGLVKGGLRSPNPRRIDAPGARIRAHLARKTD